MEIKFKLNNPKQEFLLGIFHHSLMEFKSNEENNQLEEVGVINRLVFGFLVISIEIYYK